MNIKNATFAQAREVVATSDTSKMNPGSFL